MTEALEWLSKKDGDPKPGQSPRDSHSNKCDVELESFGILTDETGSLEVMSALSQLFP